MAGKRISKAKIRAALKLLYARFTTREFEDACEQVGISYGRAVRRLRSDGFAHLVDSQRSLTRVGRPRHVYEKLPKRTTPDVA